MLTRMIVLTRPERESTANKTAAICLCSFDQALFPSSALFLSAEVVCPRIPDGGILQYKWPSIHQLSL